MFHILNASDFSVSIVHIEVVSRMSRASRPGALEAEFKVLTRSATVHRPIYLL